VATKTSVTLFAFSAREPTVGVEELSGAVSALLVQFERHIGWISPLLELYENVWLECGSRSVVQGIIFSDSGAGGQGSNVAQWGVESMDR
jgi:hypothetical protein